jgi:CubicO group peptidase (beta-lactamase class C family)
MHRHATLHRRSQLPLAVLSLLAAALLLAPPPGQAASGAAQEAAPAVPEAVGELLAALSAGDPAAFEAMAQQRFAPSALQRRSPEERRRMMERFHDDFGTLTVTAVRQSGAATVVVEVAGSTGASGRLTIDLEPAPPRRIVGLRVDLGGPRDGDEEEAPPLPPPPVDGGMTAEALAAGLDPYLSQLTADDRFSGVVLVARDGRPLFVRAYGLAERADGVPNTPETRFNLASIGKAFTKVAVGQLLSRGRLSLDDPISKFLPDYPNQEARRATVGQLVEHRGGLPDIFGPRFAATPRGRLRSNHDWMALFADLPPEFEPGSRNRYCNACYVVLGEIVAAVAGVPYEQYVTEHVFAPAGMVGAGFFASDDIVPRVARGYTRRGPEGKASEWRDAVLLHGARGSAAGGSYATAADLLAFDEALRGHRLLDPERTAWFYGEPQASPGRSTAALGIAGGAPGTSTVLEADGRWTVIVLANLDPKAGEGLGVVLYRALSG